MQYTCTWQEWLHQACLIVVRSNEKVWVIRGMTDPYGIWGICLLHLNPLGKSPASTVAKPIWNLPIASVGIRGGGSSQKEAAQLIRTHTVNACVDIWGIISELWQRELWWPISINSQWRYKVEWRFLFTFPTSQVGIFWSGINTEAVPGQSLCKLAWLKRIQKRPVQELWLCDLHGFLSKSRQINICENPHHVLCSCIINCVGCCWNLLESVSRQFSIPQQCQHLEHFYYLSPVHQL